MASSMVLTPLIGLSSLIYEDLPLDLLQELWETKKDFDSAKEKASISKASGPRAPKI